MSTLKDFNPSSTVNKDILSNINNTDSVNIANVKKLALKPIHIWIIIAISILIATLVIALPLALSKKKKKPPFRPNFNNTELFEENEETEEFSEIQDYSQNLEEEEIEETDDPNIYEDVNSNNYIKITFDNDFVIPSDGNIQVVGVDFPQKNSITIIGKNNIVFIINENGTITGVTKEDFPLYYSFKEPITNSSYLFKDVKCFSTIDISKMDGSRIIDSSNMFENCGCREIYFETGKKHYFGTTENKSARQMFMNCNNLTKIQFPSSFNVGKSVNSMFKGCHMLKDVNISLLSTTEIEDMESMFEDCLSLKDISFSNDFLTGEVKSLSYVFKNTHLNVLDISYLRLFNLINYINIFEGASIKGILKLGKFYPNDDIRDNLFREIARITDSSSTFYAPSGTVIKQKFQDIYYSERRIHINVIVIDIDYNIDFRENDDYILYSNYLHIGLGWDYDSSNIYDLDSSVLTFDSGLNFLNRVNFNQLSAYEGAIRLNIDDLTGEGKGDDEEIRISLDLLPIDVQTFTIQLNSYNRNSLKYVKSAYIRLSSNDEVIGTYSITQAGDNIGLLIGCFTRRASNTWHFTPLNRDVPGHIVTESIDSIIEILRLINANS